MEAQHLAVGAGAAILFLTSIIMITLSLSIKSWKPDLSKNGFSVDLERSETDRQRKPKSCVYINEPLCYRRRSFKAFAPRLISIGPFHFSAVRKLPMQHLKSTYLQHCLERPSQNLQLPDIEAKKTFIRNFIRKKKGKISQCYAGYNSKCESYDRSFADNILKDAFFIIELFLRELKSSEHSEDEIISCKWKRNDVRDDLILAENQLPYFVLRELYNLVFNLSAGYPSFDSLTQYYFRNLPLIIGSQEGPDNCCSGSSSCMEDCFRSFFYCFWTRQLTTCCNSENSDGNHVAILISDAPLLHFTDFFRDLVVKRKRHDEGSSSSPTGNTPLLEGSSSSSSTAVTDVNTGPSSSPSRGKWPIHEGSTSSSSTGNRPLLEGSSSSTALVTQTDSDGDLHGDGISSSSTTRTSTTSSSSSTEMTGVNGSLRPSSSPSRGKGKIHEVSALSSPTGDGDGFIAVPSATRLQLAGVKLKASKEGSLIDIRFENGVLSILPLELDDNTERELQNLIVFEQCHYQEEAYICSYIKFIESLVKTEDDADLLIDKGVIINKLAGGVKEVRELLQSLCKDIVLPSFFYQDVCLQLKNHRENCWYRTVAGFMHEYFSKPWLRVGTVIAILVFFITFSKFIFPYSGIAPPPVKHSG